MFKNGLGNSSPCNMKKCFALIESKAKLISQTTHYTENKRLLVNQTTAFSVEPLLSMEPLSSSSSSFSSFSRLLLKLG